MYNFDTVWIRKKSQINSNLCAQFLFSDHDSHACDVCMLTSDHSCIGLFLLHNNNNNNNFYLVPQLQLMPQYPKACCIV